MIEHEAPAWTADWLVGWLAAVGLTYLDRRARLRWSDDPIPFAIVMAPADLDIEQVFPTEAHIRELAIAPEHDRFGTFGRKHIAPSLEYQQRATMARANGDLSVGATLSDIGISAGEELPHSPLDPAAPGPAGPLAQRLLRTREQAGSLALVDSMKGTIPLQATNGLGYDLRRLKQKAVPGENLLGDPVAETLAFFGSVLFTQSGDRTRGWSEGSMFADGAFSWMTWSEPLGWAAIDAFLDLHYSNSGDEIVGYRVFESIAYHPAATADVTRGYAGVPRANTST